MSIKEQLLQSLATTPDYRHAFVEEKIRSGLAAQIKTIRERREGMTQTAFAKKLGKTQSWVSRLEDPNEPIPTVPTLLLIARAFDIGLEVRFASFADLLEDMAELSEESLDVPAFDRDPGLVERELLTVESVDERIVAVVGASNDRLPVAARECTSDQVQRRLRETSRSVIFAQHAYA